LRDADVRGSGGFVAPIGIAFRACKIRVSEITLTVRPNALGCICDQRHETNHRAFDRVREGNGVTRSDSARRYCG
jgi:hypothetical protein